MITHRPVIGSLRNSGNSILLDLVLGYPPEATIRILLRPATPHRPPGSSSHAGLLLRRDHTLSLAGISEFSRRIPLLQCLHLPVLHYKLINAIGKLWSPEPQSLDGNKLLRRRARKHQR
jgi:hypothetical protein